MPRQLWHVWAVLLFLSISINAQTETSTSVSLNVLDSSIEKSLEATVSITTSTDAHEITTSTKSNSETTPLSTTFEPLTTTIAKTTSNPETTTVSQDIITTGSTYNPSTAYQTTSPPEPQTTISSSEKTTTVFEPQTTNSFISIVDIETTTEHRESTDKKNDFPHPGKPQWVQTEPFQPSFGRDEMSLPADELVAKITNNLAQYIRTLIHDQTPKVSSYSITEAILKELRAKLDDSDLNSNSDNLDAIRTTTKMLCKNLPITINSIISNINNAADDHCPVKFTFFDRIYCMKFDINLAASAISEPFSTQEIITNSPSDISVKSFRVYKPTYVDIPPPTWQKWLNPSMVQDQPISTTNQPTVVCYYTNWAQYRNGPGRFYPENLDPKLCTHIIYAFGQLTNGVIAPYEWNDESTAWSTGMYARMMNLRKATQSLTRPKILLALGGWNHGSGKFSDMAQNAAKRATFVSTTIIFLQKYQFDGLDLDWEYPGSREGSRPSDKQYFTKLIIELKTAFRPYSLLLTAAVGAGKPTIDAAYEIPQVCEHLDLVNLMAYDLRGSWETETGIHVGLFGRQNDTANNKQLTQDWAVRYWIKNGCPPSKLVLGLALYGRTFRLANVNKHGIGALAVGPGAAGLNTGEAGFLAYYEICTRIQQQAWTKVFDDEQKANYAYKGEEWVGFDDTYSISFKVQYAKDMHLGGIMFWAPDLDDFTGGLCNEGKYPLMTTAVNLYRGRDTLPPSTKTSTSPTTESMSTVSTSQYRKRVVCYYTNWAQYRPDGGKFFPENLDASLCTHVIFAFAVLKDSKLASFEWNDEDTQWSKGMYSRLMELKKTNAIKVSLALGGWNFGSGPLSDMVGNEQLRRAFVQQATQFIRDNQFDGLDLDWEYPGSRDGSRPEDKRLFTILVQELRAAFRPYNLLLTAAVGAGEPTILAGYEIDKLAPHLDFINLMTYDLHGGGWENVTGLHTALYSRPEEAANETTLNQDWAVNHWIEQGMPKEKISMGLATYGRTFKLADRTQTYIGAPAVGAGEAGNYTREPGFLAYYEICEKLNSGGWTSKFDDVQKSMYAFSDDMWVGYDNADTLTIRANYINEKGLGGVMIWAPDLDDFSGKFCNRGRYPLMNTVVNLIRSGTIVPVVTPTVTTATTISRRWTSATLPSPATPFSAASSATKALPTVASSTLKPSITSSSPSVVCMTTDNSRVFQTLNPNLCTHLIIVQSPSSTEADVFQSTLSSYALEQLRKMKAENQKIVILYSILGSWKANHLDLIRNNQQRQDFNRRIRQYLVDNSLDGLDIDWNIQSEEVSSSTDKYLLSAWLTELRNTFASDQLILTIGVSGDKVVIDNSYELISIANTVNFIRLMAFDWKSANMTNLINPLYSVKNQLDDNQQSHIDWAVKYLIILGVPSELITLGLPTFGRWFELANPSQNTIGSPYIDSSITVAYSDICKLLKSNDFTRVYDKRSRSSYAFNFRRKQWISSDTKADVALKATYAKVQGLAGITLSLIDSDDIEGQCEQGSYPLLHAVAEVFGLYIRQTSSTGSVDNQRSFSRQSHVLCSVSGKADTYRTRIRFTLDKIDTGLCTHLLVDHQSSLLSASISKQLKESQTNLKILVTIPLNEHLDIDQLKLTIEKKNADGVNIQITANRSASNITELLQTIRQSWPKKYLLTVSTQAPTEASDQMSFFQIIDLHRYADLLILLPFDDKSVENFNEIQPWNSLASFVQANHAENIGDFSMVATLLFALSSGVPKEKLILSIPTYGLSFMLEDENKYQIGDSILAQGYPGRQTRTVGMLASYEICDRLRLDNYDRVLSLQSVIVAAHKKTNLILFDDTHALQVASENTINGTVELKANFIKNSQVGGVLIHSIDLDDYTGASCELGTFPITSIVSRIFSPPNKILTSTVEATTMGISTAGKGPCSNMKTTDLMPDERDCRYYYVCSPKRDRPMAHLQCPNNMYFSPTAKACTHEYVPCSAKSESSPATKATEIMSIPSFKLNRPFICPTPNGLFGDQSDCTQFFSCSNNRAITMKCPQKTKFNSELQRCDWSSDLCP